MVESSPSGSDYLAEICQEWEAAAQETQSPTRVVILRTGLVLAKEGGVLGRMVPVFNIFAGTLTSIALSPGIVYWTRRSLRQWTTVGVVDSSR